MQEEIKQYKATVKREQEEEIKRERELELTRKPPEIWEARKLQEEKIEVEK